MRNLRGAMTMKHEGADLRRVVRTVLLPVACAIAVACGGPEAERVPVEETAAEPGAAEAAPEPEFTLTTDQTHNRFSRTIAPVLRVQPGAVIEAYTKEASDGQLGVESEAADLLTLDFDPIHPLTGPVFVEGAEPGDLLAVTLHEIEVGDWGWSAVAPGFGFLSEEFDEPYLKIYRFEPGATSVEFAPGIEVPLRPFPGVVGVAPDTDSLLSTIPPRANGGNLDDRDLVEGTTIYLPVFVEGALFSIGDTHAAQGDGEVCGTAIEAPMRIVYELNLIKDGRAIPSPQYETDTFYAVTGFAETIDEAARRATRAMIDYLVDVHGLERTDAYVLSSLAANLKIAEVVDVPHMLVTMRIPKNVLGGAAG